MQTNVRMRLGSRRSGFSLLRFMCIRSVPCKGGPPWPPLLRPRRIRARRGGYGGPPLHELDEHESVCEREVYNRADADRNQVSRIRVDLQHADQYEHHYEVADQRGRSVCGVEPQKRYCDAGPWAVTPGPSSVPGEIV